MSAGTRVFKGVSAEQRRRERRVRLEEAALDLIAERGWAQTTMTDVCRAAGLTERYFYESFATRDALHVAIVERLALDLRDRLLAAVATGSDPEQRVAAAADVLVAFFLDDPRIGRAALSEGLGSAELQRRRREILAGFGDLLRARSASIFGPEARVDRLAAAAIVGAVAELMLRRLDGELRVSRPRLSAYVARIVLALARAGG